MSLMQTEGRAAGTALELSHVSFRYTAEKAAVLQDVSLKIARGSLVALLGPNGSGKTTLIRIASGVVKPESGQVLLDGRPLARYSRGEVARRLAVVPQQLYMPFAFSVYEMVAMGRTPHLRGMAAPGHTDRQAIEKALMATDILSLSDRLFSELSGGEQQRVVIAMALAQEPEVLILDEPTTHLDIEHQVDILDLLMRLNRESNLTVLASTHDLNLAALYFDRLILMKQGKPVADGTPEEVMQAEIIRSVFNTGVAIQYHPVTARPYLIVLPPRHESK